MTRNEDTSAEASARESAGHDLAGELQALRAHVAAMADSLQGFGARAGTEAKGRAQALSEEAIAETLRGVGELRQQLDSLQGQVERDVRARPLAWLAGAVGLGVLFGLILSRRD